MFEKLDAYKYPRGVFVMFFIQLISMVGFSFVMYLLVLYATNALHFTDKHAYSINAAYIALMYGAHVSGGWVSERYFGYRRAIILGTVISALGLAFLMIPSAHAVPLALSAFIVGSGLMIPCTFVLLGRIYAKNHPHRELGFVLSYIGMNVGSFFACAFAGPLQQWIGFAGVFLIGTVVQVILLFYFLVYQNIFSEEPQDKKAKKLPEMTKQKIWIGHFWNAVCFAVIVVLLNYSDLCNQLLLVMGALSVFYVIYLAMKEQGEVRRNMLAFLMLTVIALCFWSLYMLSASALTIFIERNVDRNVFHWLVPTASFSSINPFFIIVLGPFMGSVWYLLYRVFKWKVSISAKFSMGLMFMGAGFLLLVWGIHSHDSLGKISVTWIVLSYLLQTIGELLVGPVGFSMVGDLVPARMEAFMVGIWELSSGIAGTISGYLASMTTVASKSKAPLITDPVYSHNFALFGLTVAGIGVLVALLKPLVTRSNSGNMGSSVHLNENPLEGSP